MRCSATSAAGSLPICPLPRDSPPALLRCIVEPAFADFDLDGRVDVVFTALGAKAELWRNSTEPAGHWARYTIGGETIESRWNRCGHSRVDRGGHPIQSHNDQCRVRQLERRARPLWPGSECAG